MAYSLERSIHKRTPSWLYHNLPLTAVTDPNSWPPRNPSVTFDWSRPTHLFYAAVPLDSDSVEQNHSYQQVPENNNAQSTLQRTALSLAFSPTFQHARSRLDYSYHTNLVLNRQYLQDAILKRVVESAQVASDDAITILSSRTETDQEQRETVNGSSVSDPEPTTFSPRCDPANTSRNNDFSNSGNSPQSVLPAQRRPWIIFTAGAMGVGKGYVLMQLQRLQLLDVSSFVKIDPDLIKTELPEMAGYLQHDRATAATLLHRESTQMADVLLEHALSHSYSLLVDGSLRDVDYYRKLLQRLRCEFASYRLAIVHVVADPDIVWQRARARAERTGRVVPTTLLMESLQQVPCSVDQLAPLVDVVFTIANNDGQPLELVSMTRRDTILSSSTASSAASTDESTEQMSATTATTITTVTWGEFARTWTEDDLTIADAAYKPQTEPIAAGNGPGADKAIDSCTNDSRTNEMTGSPTSTTDTLSLPYKNKISSHIVNMADVMTCSVSHAVAHSMWKTAYPNVCPRCTIACDFAHPCGICVHGVHECACSVCHERHNTTPHCSAPSRP
jgi:adenylylsulfate kinase-like enzyme